MMVVGGLRCCGGHHGGLAGARGVDHRLDPGAAAAHRPDRACFQRPEPRRRVGRFVAGLLSGVERRNGWQLAEHAGEATPDGMQRLLYQAKWDADAVCAQVVDYLGEHLGTPEGYW